MSCERNVWTLFILFKDGLVDCMALVYAAKQQLLGRKVTHRGVTAPS